MIIECQACRAGFKLDESRIKGKGARIRCRKCGETIIVMKSDIPSAKPSPPVGKELFDLRAVLREPEPKAPGPPREEVDAAIDSILPRERETERGPSPVEGVTPPPVEREQEPFAPEPVESHEEPPPAPRAEVDTAFESPLFPEGGIEESPPSVEEEPGPGKETRDALSSLELEREEKLSFLEETGDIPARGPRAPAAGDTPPVPPSPEPTIRTAAPPSPLADSIQDQLAGLSGSGRMEETYVPEPPPADIPPPRLLEIGKPVAARARTAAPAGGT